MSVDARLDDLGRLRLCQHFPKMEFCKKCVEEKIRAHLEDAARMAENLPIGALTVPDQAQARKDLAAAIPVLELII